MFNLPIQNHNGISVMSSIDLAKMCIGLDKYDHKNFMAKADKVLGISVVNFHHSHVTSRGRTIQILLLPEREACLMAMSYSYELQAKVYDAWQALRNVKPKELSPMEMIVAIATHSVKQEKALLHLESQVTHIGSEVDMIKNKLGNSSVITEQLEIGFIPIKEGYLKYCNVCTYPVFREFVINLSIPTKPYMCVIEGSTKLTPSKQIKIVNLNKLRDIIITGSYKVTACLYEHPSLTHRFKLNN